MDTCPIAKVNPSLGIIAAVSQLRDGRRCSNYLRSIIVLCIVMILVKFVYNSILLRGEKFAVTRREKILRLGQVHADNVTPLRIACVPLCWL